MPYDVVNTDEARALAAGNPLSFLHVTRSEIDLPADANPYDARVYAQAVHNFESLKRGAVPFAGLPHLAGVEQQREVAVRGRVVIRVVSEVRLQQVDGLAQRGTK